MSRNSAYRLRGRAGAEGFAWAWDHVLTAPGTGKRKRPEVDWRKVTLAALEVRAASGMVQPLLYRGRVYAIRRKPDDSALLRLLRRCDAADRARLNRAVAQ